MQARVLPSPNEVRLANRRLGGVHADSFNRPPPVHFPSLGLLVKYGADVTVREANAQTMIRKKLGDRVPVPEVFAWVEDQEQVFIYMELIQGDTLQTRWESLDEANRRSVCSQLRFMVDSWRSLTQESSECYLGSSCGQPLNDVFLKHRPELVGPFKGPNAVEQFQHACDIEISQHSSIVFTHADLVAPNIMLSSDANPIVAAIIDWGQAGWYPEYWEYCKARRVNVETDCFSPEIQDEWRLKYLPLVMDEVGNETCYYPWLHFVLSKGI